MTSTMTEDQKCSSTMIGEKASATSRRRFLAGEGMVGAATALGPRLAFATPNQPASGDALVVIFLRGGADGLSLTPPYGHQSYRDARPTIALLPPGSGTGSALPLDTASSANAVFPTGIDGVVGLHPAMAPIHDTLWVNGQLAIIPACGLPRSESRTRSHFSAERYWERGSASSSVRTGWLNRMLTAQGGSAQVPAISSSYHASDLLKGPTKSITVPRLSQFGLRGFDNGSRAFSTLQSMYSGNSGSIGVAGSEVLSVVSTLDQLDPDAGMAYPGDGFSRSLKDIAIMLRSNIGLRAAHVDYGSWDHHGNLGAPGDVDGPLHKRAAGLAQGLRAFTDDLASDGSLNEVTILVITEFGRTIHENGSQGTDHGRAATVFAMGGGIQGGVFGDDYPAVIEDDPDDSDLSVMTDFRKPVSEILANRVGVGNVFPTFTPAAQAMGITRP